MTLTPEQRSLVARIGAYALHASHDSTETTRAARSAFLARFERQVDPERRLPEEERQRRAEAARRAYFTTLSLKSARARAGGRKSARRRPQKSTRDEAGRLQTPVLKDDVVATGAHLERGFDLDDLDATPDDGNRCETSTEPWS